MLNRAFSKLMTQSVREVQLLHYAIKSSSEIKIGPLEGRNKGIS